MTYNDLTLEQFIRCVDVLLDKDIQEHDQAIHVAAIMFNKSVDEIEEMPFDKSEKLIGKAKSLMISKPTERVKRFLWINGRLYKAIKEVGQFSEARFLSLEHYRNQENRHLNLHKEIALLYVPVFSRLTEHSCYPNQPLHKTDAMATAILKKKVGDVYGAAFFFAKRYRNISLDIQVFLKLTEARALMEKIKLDRDRSTDHSKSITAGTSIST